MANSNVKFVVVVCLLYYWGVKFTPKISIRVMKYAQCWCCYGSSTCGFYFLARIHGGRTEISSITAPGFMRWFLCQREFQDCWIPIHKRMNNHTTTNFIGICFTKQTNNRKFSFFIKILSLIHQTNVSWTVHTYIYTSYHRFSSRQANFWKNMNFFQKNSQNWRFFWLRVDENLHTQKHSHTNQQPNTERDSFVVAHYTHIHITYIFSPFFSLSILNSSFRLL